MFLFSLYMTNMNNWHQNSSNELNVCVKSKPKHIEIYTNEYFNTFQWTLKLLFIVNCYQLWWVFSGSCLILILISFLVFNHMFYSFSSGFIVSQLGFIALGVNPTCSIWQLYRTGQGPGSTAELRTWGHISGSSHQLWEQSRSPCRGHPPAFRSGGWASPSFSVWWKTCRASLISLIAAISQKVGVYSGIAAGGDTVWRAIAVVDVSSYGSDFKS